MINQLRSFAKNHLVNVPGWSTKRKIIVIESDDWGMIRMASKKSYDWFLNKGYSVDRCPYNQNDALESNDDLEFLFEVLSSVKDHHGNAAVFTANNIVANPDFEKIKDSGFSKYYFEPFTKTLKQYSRRDRVIDLYKQGINGNIFCPQFHGREHLNVNRWMDGLNSGNKILLDAFEQRMFTVHKSGSVNGRRDYLDAFGKGYKNQWVEMEDVIQSGLDLFEKIWGYQASAFMAPCFVWPVEIEGILAERGIKYIQGTHVQRIPFPANKHKIKKKYHYQGQKNFFGQRYLVRNVFFEPAGFVSEDSVDRTLKEIEIAFRFKKPAIISSHRVNYIGSIRPENRDKNLKLLASLLQRIVKRFPNVEFMSSDQLGKFMTGEN